MARIIPFVPPHRRLKRSAYRNRPHLSFRRFGVYIRRHAGFTVLLFAAILIFSQQHNAGRPASLVSPAPLIPYDGIHVVDGDTIRTNGERIRILGLDTPEYGKGARCREEATAAEMARHELQRLLAKGEVAIARQGTDRYGRSLARVTVDGVDVADVLIAQDLARPYNGGYRQGWCG